MKILVVDNHDSFTYNLVQYLLELGADCTVITNNENRDIKNYDGILISPGPGNPNSAGLSLQYIADAYNHKIPLLGVCLGMQAIAQYFGAEIIQAPELMHGYTSEVQTQPDSLFSNIPSTFTATRYHSLIVDRKTLPDSISVIAEVDEIVMALRKENLCGVQFHPESVLTEHGHSMLANWLAECGDKAAKARAVGLSPIINKN